MIGGILYKLKVIFWKRKGLTIGQNCIIGSFLFGTEPWLINIGNHVKITSGTRFITHDGSTWVFREQTGYERVIRYGKITIQDNVFIGNNTIILPGVTIGRDSIIGAGSVVTKDIPPGSVAAGMPAKIISDLQSFSQKCLKESPEYNYEEYRKNKKREILRLLDKEGELD